MENPTQVFEKDLGIWDAEVEVRPQPGAAAQRSQGVSVNRLLGGRWLVTDFKNDTSGFEGHGIYGWDVAKQKFVGTWVDSMRGSLVITDGNWDPARRTMTYRGEMTMGERKISWREQTQSIDSDTQIFRSFLALPDGGEHEMMTVTYRRRATGAARRTAPGVMLQRLSGPLNALLAGGTARVDGDVIELFLNGQEAAEGGMVTISMRVPVHCPECAGAMGPCARCDGKRTVEELFSAWLAVPPEVADGTVITPSVLLSGMVRPASFRVRLAGAR
jgi:hypothetical protein